MEIGTAVITEKEAALWTDGRYFLQASQQLSKEWTLMKSGLPDTPSIPKWLLSKVSGFRNDFQHAGRDIDAGNSLMMGI